MIRVKGINLIFSVLVCVIIFVPSSKAQEALPDLVARIKPSVVSIGIFDKNGKKIASGSGFCIAENRIITNKHVIEDAARIVVQITDGDVYNVIKIDSVDKEGDLALLVTEPLPSQIKPLTISKLSPREGEKVLVVGSPLGLEGSISDGIVAAFRNKPGIGKLIQITAPISPGSSGGPVINIWGEVMGVTTLNLEGGQNLNFAISSERIISLWSNQLTISNNTFSNSPVSAITEEQRLKAEQLYLKGELLYGNKECDKALSNYLEAIRINPNYDVAHLGAGICKMELKQYREAAENLRQVIRIYPKNISLLEKAYYNLGLVYIHLKQYEEAAEVLKQTIRLNPDSYLAFHYLGLSHAELKRFKEAENSFQKSIELNVSNNQAHKAVTIYSLGMVYIMLGDKNSALQQQKLLINLDVDRAKELLSRLSNMSGNWRSVDSKGRTIPSLSEKIFDNGIKITSQTIFNGEPGKGAVCEGNWEGDYAFGVVTNFNSEIICAFKRIDLNQLKYISFARKNYNEPIEKSIQEAKKLLEKTSLIYRRIQ